MVLVVHTFQNSQEEIKENPMIKQEVLIIKNVNLMVLLISKAKVQVNFQKEIGMTKRKENLQERMIEVILLKKEEHQNQMIVMTRKRVKQQNHQEKEENNYLI